MALRLPPSPQLPIAAPADCQMPVHGLQVKDFSRTSRTVNSAIVVGGTNMSEQRGDLRAGVEVVVATPGRFIDHLQQVGASLPGCTQPCLADDPCPGSVCC